MRTKLISNFNVFNFFAALLQIYLLNVFEKLIFWVFSQFLTIQYFLRIYSHILNYKLHSTALLTRYLKISLEILHINYRNSLFWLKLTWHMFAKKADVTPSPITTRSLLCVKKSPGGTGLKFIQHFVSNFVWIIFYFELIRN